MSVNYYKNLTTGEITTSHREAVAWLVAGDTVECVATNGRRLRWDPIEK